jgi:hypothetical protein
MMRKDDHRLGSAAHGSCHARLGRIPRTADRGPRRVATETLSGRAAAIGRRPGREMAMGTRLPTSLRLLATALLLSLARCRRSTAAPLTSLAVQLSFTHQAEFAGFYATEQEGFYAAEGL